MPLPRGRHSLSRDEVESSQRSRLLRATIEVVFEHGYADATVSEIVTRARTAKRTFYNYFDDKQDCFVATYDTFSNVFLREVAQALDPESPPALRIEQGIGAFVGVLAANPQVARVCVVDVMTAGPIAVSRRAAVHRAFARVYLDELNAARSREPGLPPITGTQALAVVGAVHEPIYMMLQEAGAERLLELVPPLTATVTAMAYSQFTSR